MTFEELLRLTPSSLDQPAKEAVLLDLLNETTRWHRARCVEYDRLLRILHPGFDAADRLDDIPFVPVGLFKTHKLLSVPTEAVTTILSSSGTTGQQVSRIYLDRVTAQRQTAALVHALSAILGTERLPMIIIDTEAVLRDPAQFSARAAGIRGLMNFGRQHFYALDQNMELDRQGLAGFVSKHGGRPFLMFGFTFMVWQYFYQRIAEAGMDLSRGILIHSGGWKKLQDQAVTNSEFKSRLHKSTGLKRVHNFYGLAEQVGGIFLEGEDGYLHPPNFCDVIIRDPVTWHQAPPGVPGVIQVLSPVPLSYPGHSILTEDIGVLHSTDDPASEWQGKSFTVIGRAPRAELRGCSDTHAFAAVTS